MKLMVLSNSIHTCNTSGFLNSGFKTKSHFRKLNLQKGLNRPQILLEVHETLQAYSACPNKQKSHGDLLLSSILFKIIILED